MGACWAAALLCCCTFQHAGRLLLKPATGAPINPPHPILALPHCPPVPLRPTPVADACLQVSVMDYRGAGGWIRLSIDDTGGRAAVKSVAVKGGDGGDWKPLSNSWGATWELSSAPAAPLSFKVGVSCDRTMGAELPSPACLTVAPNIPHSQLAQLLTACALSCPPSLPQIVGDEGEEVIADNVVKQSGGISGGAYSDRATFAAGVQFSISDPAFNTVSGRRGGACASVGHLNRTALLGSCIAGLNLAGGDGSRLLWTGH